VHLVLDICQGVGIASAVGIRPFLPALAVGALAAGDIQIDFMGTHYSFLESGPFLLGMLVGAVLLALAERRLGPKAADRRPLVLVIGAAGLALGALLFAGALAQNRYTVWPGLIAGVLCAAVGVAATRPLFARVRARLDPTAARAVPLYIEGLGIAVAVLSVLAPPVGVVALVLLAWLLLAGRRREDQKYAGLRILR
jgi:MFS family permease